MAQKTKDEQFTLVIPLEVSGVEDFKSGEDVKVLAKDRKGNFHTQKVKIGPNRKGTAEFSFSSHPGSLHVVLGPADASNEELVGLQTLSFDVSSRQWADKEILKLPPIVIHPYYWFWWIRWCRIFTIRGRVVCPNGSPVPAAKVCAYDVDRWFIWSSTQLVGCAMTDINGAFEIKFRWCCGWWPWWWWRYRVWQRDSLLSKLVSNTLLRTPEIRLSPTPGNQPSLEVFNYLLAEEGLDKNQPLQPYDVSDLEQIRSRLLAKLPAIPELERLKIWPWYPWYPWWDCTPDLIFKVTQDCQQPDTVIVDEGTGDTRWNIPNPFDVTLVANELACCPTTCQDPPCDEGECLVFTQVCGNAIHTIGGNPGALATPAGYLRPGAILPATSAYNGDRPFGGIVNVWKNEGDMIAVDYYEVEYDDGLGWKPLPPGAGFTIIRNWLLWDNSLARWFSGNETFPYDVSTFPGHAVYQSRECFEATGPYSDWWPAGTAGGDFRFWTSGEFLIMRLNSTQFADGTYRFRVWGYELGPGGNLVNGRVLPFCGTQQDNYLVLTFDNRSIDTLLNTPLDPCSPGTPSAVKLCTTEPATDFIAVRIDGQLIDPCDVVDASSGILEIDFRVHDSSGHLARYWLWATYKENLRVDLLTLPGASLTPLTASTQVGPTYGEALGQGATAPYWHGGNMRLRVPAKLAFPEPCCYQLELRAWKRTVVDCNHHYPHRNRSEYTLGVGVCPPQPIPVQPVIQNDEDPLVRK
jgi:hypothetical protein